MSFVHLCERRRAHQSLRLRPQAGALKEVREFAAEAARRCGMCEPDRNDFVLAANEAAANAIEHGLPCSDGTIHLWALERGETLVLAIRNAGEFIFKTPPSDPCAERGRGLEIVSGLMDTVALTRIDGHVQIEISKRFS
jgi:anti-sigma regulatory factor (Ser/Thr protein kinase)